MENRCVRDCNSVKESGFEFVISKVLKLSDPIYDACKKWEEFGIFVVRLGEESDPMDHPREVGGHWIFLCCPNNVIDLMIFKNQHFDKNKFVMFFVFLYMKKAILGWVFNLDEIETGITNLQRIFTQKKMFSSNKKTEQCRKIIFSNE